MPPLFLIFKKYIQKKKIKKKIRWKVKTTTTIEEEEYKKEKEKKKPKTEHRILACGKWSSQSLTPLCWVYKKALLDEYRLTVEFENPARPNRTTFFG